MDRKAYLKEWRLANKEKIKEYNSSYFQENKESILVQRNKSEKETGYKHMYNEQTKTCECGKQLKVKSLYNHRKICGEYKKYLATLLLEKRLE